jgi:hypothetical protein
LVEKLVHLLVLGLSYMELEQEQPML